MQQGQPLARYGAPESWVGGSPDVCKEVTVGDWTPPILLMLSVTAGQKTQRQKHLGPWIPDLTILKSTEYTEKDPGKIHLKK